MMLVMASMRDPAVLDLGIRRLSFATVDVATPLPALSGTKCRVPATIDEEPPTARWLRFPTVLAAPEIIPVSNGAGPHC